MVVFSFVLITLTWSVEILFHSFFFQVMRICESGLNTSTFPSVPFFVLYAMSVSISVAFIFPSQTVSPSSEKIPCSFSRHRKCFSYANLKACVFCLSNCFFFFHRLMFTGLNNYVTGDVEFIPIRSLRPYSIKMHNL